MPRFKKFDKSRRPSQPTPLGIPTHVDTGLIGFGTTPDLDISPEGVLRLD